MINLYQGDCLEVLKTFPDNSVEAVVTDPPYGLSFMGKKWDYDVPSVEVWKEVIRVLKPGGHLLAFGGTRTYHRLVVAIEDAGFEIRDQVQWIYGQGFPKSQNISIQIDKSAGVMGHRGKAFVTAGQDGRDDLVGTRGVAGFGNYEPITNSAKQWEGWGTALKPANEPICLARKPLEKGLTVAQNVQKWGTGGLNIDGSRIGLNGEKNPSIARYESTPQKGNNGWEHSNRGANFNPESAAQGRFPANVIFDEAAGETLDLQTGDLGASRFFYCAKASTSERNAGLEGVEPKLVGSAYGQTGSGKPSFQDDLGGPNTPNKWHAFHKNIHPTVKPVKLMEYLVKLITPPNSIVLDPFMGSGTTGIACKNLGFEFVGIELSPEYFEIAKKRTA